MHRYVEATDMHKSSRGRDVHGSRRWKTDNYDSENDMDRVNNNRVKEQSISVNIVNLKTPFKLYYYSNTGRLQI